jgi:hypothetical protein
MYAATSVNEIVIWHAQEVLAENEIIYYVTINLTGSIWYTLLQKRLFKREVFGVG